MADETVLHEVKGHLVACASIIDGLLRDSADVSPRLAAEFVNATRIFSERAEQLLAHIGRRAVDDPRVAEEAVAQLRTAVTRVRELHGVLVELPAVMDPYGFREQRDDFAPPWRQR